jgi:hypothetical protein
MVGSGPEYCSGNKASLVLAMWPIWFGNVANLVWQCGQSGLAMWPIWFGNVANLVWQCGQSGLLACLFALWFGSRNLVLFRGMPSP